jgi:aspartyl-tRNA(Asn)/glutamyl-tRNA(Gln) amidotransferase subunit B
MEEGSLRCDANVSLRPAGSGVFGTKVEIKNMNSVRSLERALAYEIVRQAAALDAGEPVVQETRHWDEDAGATKSMRSKEEAFDYRYFPEPDIPALEPDEGWIEDIRASLPESPRDRRERYATLGVKPETARVLVGDRGSVALFDRAVGLGADPVATANWVTQDVAALRNTAGDGELSAEHVADVVALVADGTLSNAGGKQALEEAHATGSRIADVVDRKGLRQVSDTGELGAWADEVIAENPDAVEKFRTGKEGVIGFLVGQLMKKAGGAANPKVAQGLLRERLQA